MRDFLRRITNDRTLYMLLILFNAPRWAAYSLHLNLPAFVTASPFYIITGVTILTLDVLVILAYALHAIFALVEYLTDR
jgi:hypothetical protein